MRRGVFARVALGVAVMGGLLSAPTGAQAAPTLQARKNLVDSCVTEYDPRVDYFPEKAKFTQAKRIRLTYRRNYKLVEVRSAFSRTTYRYALVQCGTPVPNNLPSGTVVIEVPVRRAISADGGTVDHMARLNLLDRLVGAPSYVENPQVKAKLDSGELVKVETGKDNLGGVERLLSANADVLFSQLGLLELEKNRGLRRDDLKVAVYEPYGEGSLLAIAELIKFIAAFFNAEGAANIEFDRLSERYQQQVRLARKAQTRTEVLVGFVDSKQGTLCFADGLSPESALVKDAGGRYAALFNRGPNLYPCYNDEQKIDRVIARKPAVWLYPFSIDNIASIAKANPRLLELPAVQSGQVWVTTKEYYSLRAKAPDLILRDLIHILHPELLPDHQPVAFRKLQN